MRMKHYEFLEKIGKGTHGTTYLLRSNIDKKYVVCKSVPNKNKKHANREVKILNITDHKRIIKLVDFVTVKKGFYILLEHANYGTLDSMIKYFTKHNIYASDNLIWSIAAQLLEGIKYLHSKNIIHRDIKPANILINRTEIKSKEYLEFKICDFSLSVTEPYNDEKCIVGTPYYMAPEIVKKQSYDQNVDIWSLGVILYELCYNKKPFVAETREELYNKIKNESVDEKIKNEAKQIEPALENLIRNCLKRNERLSSKELFRNEKIKLTLTTIELKYREMQIEQLHERILEIEKKGSKLIKQ